MTSYKKGQTVKVTVEGVIDQAAGAYIQIGAAYANIYQVGVSIEVITPLKAGQVWLADGRRYFIRKSGHDFIALGLGDTCVRGDEFLTHYPAAILVLDAPEEG